MHLLLAGELNTNIKLSLTDEERATLAQNWFGRSQLVSRKEVNAFVDAQVQLALAGSSDETGRDTDPTVESTVEKQPQADGDPSIRGFVPSRGDEDYIYSGEDPELTAHCRSILDGLEFLDRYTWAALERNRK